MSTVQHRDKQKRLICHSNGITLIVIPFWWDHTIESLAQTIHQTRPDICAYAQKGSPILAELPAQYLRKGKIPSGNDIT